MLSNIWDTLKLDPQLGLHLAAQLPINGFEARAHHVLVAVAGFGLARPARNGAVHPNFGEAVHPRALPVEGRHRYGQQHVLLIPVLAGVVVVGIG